MPAIGYWWKLTLLSEGFLVFSMKIILESIQLNPIENLWSYIKWRIHEERKSVCKRSIPNTIDAGREWSRIPLRYLHALIRSMHLAEAKL